VSDHLPRITCDEPGRRLALEATVSAVARNAKYPEAAGDGVLLKVGQNGPSAKLRSCNFGAPVTLFGDPAQRLR